MMLRTLVGGLLLASLVAPACAQDEEETPVHDFSVTLTAATDYVFRGVSQTDEDPAFQASLDYAHESGFYAGLWASNVDFTPSDADFDDDADLEVDITVGFGWSFNDSWAGDVALVHYVYPGTADGFDYDYNELLMSFIWQERLTFLAGYSNDTFNSGEDGLYLSASMDWELPWEMTLTTGVGHYDLDDVLGDSYSDWTVGLGRSFGPVDMSLTYTGTDSSGEDLYGYIADDRVTLAASISF